MKVTKTNADVGTFSKVSSDVSSGTICDRRRLVLSKPVSSAVVGSEIALVTTVIVGAFCQRCVRYGPCETTRTWAKEKATHLRGFEDLDLVQ